MRLQSKIIVALIPLVVAPLLTLGWIAYAQLKETSERKTLDEIQTVMRQFELQIDAKRRTAMANIELFSRSTLLEKYILTVDDWERYNLLQFPLLQLFDSYQKAYPDYYEIRVFLPDGYEDARAATNGLQNEDEEEGESGYFKALKQSPQDIYTQYFRNPDNQTISLLVSKRIAIQDRGQDPVSAPEVLRGYLAITVDLDFINRHLASSRIGNNGSIFITDALGRILFHAKENLIGTQLRPTLFAALKENKSSEHIIRTHYNEEKALFLKKPLQDNLMLIATLPESDLLADGKRLGAAVTAITLITILLTITMLFAFIKYIVVRPILYLNKATHEIGRGNLNHTIDVNTEDEIGELAKSFDQMSQNLQRSNEQIKYLAYHDNLTGLPNRLMFNEYLEHVLNNARRSGELVALLYIDLDNFKRINDTLGHHIGDELLKQYAERLSSCLRNSDYVARIDYDNIVETVARLGGDEFIIILPSIKDQLSVATIAKRILDSVSQPFLLEQHEVFITGSIGITVYPDDGENVSTLTKNADIAMYHAKEAGKNNYMYYSQSMNEAALERLTLESGLRRALERDELVLHYQPQIDARSQTIIGVEALVRWQHPEQGLIPPVKFITIAEETGLIIPLGEWVLRESCRQIKAWQAIGINDLTVSVNLSNQQFTSGQLDSHIAAILKESDIEPHRLDVELTESSIMQNENTAANMLEAIKALGVSISLDDFGTGYSSLSYLRRFPIDTLKIDRSFVRDIVTDKDDAAIILAIIAMAHSLGLKVTAEGVEETDQFTFLQRHGCNTIQGFLFSKPLPADELEQLLLADRKLSAG